MSILFMMPNWSAASEVWMQRMIEALADNIAVIATNHSAQAKWRNRIDAISLENQEPALWRRTAARCGLPVRCWPGRSRLAVLREAVADKRVTRILTHYVDFALQFEDVWARTDKPLFVHCHGYDITWGLRNAATPRKRHFADDYPRRVLRLSRRATLIANSTHTAQKLYDIGVEPERVVVKSFGVPVPPQPPFKSVRPRTLNLLYLGRLTDFKGPDLTIYAFDLACRKGLDARLIIAGDGELRATCELARARSAFADRIHMVGAVNREEATKLLAHADVFTAHHQTGPLSHQEEAFGVALIEAMAGGLPVVSGASGAVPEVVVSGVTAMLFDPGDLKAHAEALLTLANDPALRLRMARAGWERAKALYSCEDERQQLRRILGLTAQIIDVTVPPSIVGKRSAA